MTTKPIYHKPPPTASDNAWREQTAKIRNEGCQIALSTEDLRAASEGGLLALVVACYGFRHPAEKPVDAIANLVGKDPATITHCMSGHSHLGVSGWITLENLGIDGGLFSAWLAAQKEAT